MPAADFRLHLLLPFALPGAAHARAALPALQQPSFARLLARARLTEHRRGKDFQRSAPHENWLARHFNVIADDVDDEAPLSAYQLLADGGARAEIGAAIWACIEPVHLHVAHDHLLLIEPAQLALSSDEAQALLDTARPLIESADMRLLAPTPLRWYMSAPSLAALTSASPLAAVGRNIEIWLPYERRTGAHARAWMKLQNEIQMAWFEHPVNRARAAAGALTANSIWLHAPGQLKPVCCPFARVLSNAAATRGLGLASGLAALASVDAPPASFDALSVSGHTLVELETLTQPFLRQDWAAWRAAFTLLERNWFTPALAALQSGALQTLTLTLGGDARTLTLTAARADLRRFWRRRAIALLLE